MKLSVFLLACLGIGIAGQVYFGQFTINIWGFLLVICMVYSPIGHKLAKKYTSWREKNTSKLFHFLCSGTFFAVAGILVVYFMPGASEWPEHKLLIILRCVLEFTFELGFFIWYRADLEKRKAQEGKRDD